MTEEPSNAEFDPAVDAARSSSNATVKEVYEKLREEGHRHAAEELRDPEAWESDALHGESGQIETARRLSKEHLPGWKPTGRLRW